MTNPLRGFVHRNRMGVLLLVTVFLVTALPMPTRAAQAGDGLLREAESDFSDGRLDAALQKCKAVLARNPSSAYAYYLIGAIEERRGSREEARQSLLQALHIDASLLPARILLGRILLASEKLDEAEVEFSAAVKSGDDAVKNAQYGLGLVLLARSRSKEALPHLSAAWEAQPKDLPRLYALISAELDEGMAAAREHRRLFDGISPARPEISYKLGMLFLQHHLPREAEAELRRVARMIETGEAGALPQDSISATFLNLAGLHFQGHNYRQTLQDLSRIQMAAVAPQAERDALLLAGESLIAVGESAQGLEKFREAARKNELDVGAQVRFVWAELLTNHLDAAQNLVRTLQERWPQDAGVDQMAALVAREALSPRAKVPWLADWHLTGEGVVCCPCKVPCPCRSNGPPTDTHCEATGAYRIARGHYGNVSLDNFVFVTVDANMGTSKTPLTLFVGPEASDEQLIALEHIYQAFNPLQPMIFPNVARGPISFVVRNRREYEIRIPQRLEMRIERRLDAASRPELRTAAVDPFSNVLEYARNLTYRFWDQTGNLQWDFSGRQANMRFIDLDAHDYAGSTLLYQFQDGAGSFNEQQRGLIDKLKLPILPELAAAP